MVYAENGLITSVKVVPSKLLKACSKLKIMLLPEQVWQYYDK